MKEIYQYEDLYNRLKDGKEVVPVSRDEVLMMALIDKLGSLGADDSGSEKLQEALDRLETISSGISETRSLKKLLDYTKTAYDLCASSNIVDLTGHIEFSDTSNVTSMSSMFNGAYVLETVPLFDTSKVTSMSSMFSGCRKLREVPLFDTSNVTNMSSMFYECEILKTVPLFDTSKVTRMTQMFSKCTYSLSKVPLFDTSNVTDMSSMFRECKKLFKVPSFDTSKVTDMSSMFYFCIELYEVPLFDTSKVTNMSSMFYECHNLKNVLGLDARNVTSTTGLKNMFYFCEDLQTCMIKNIKVNLQVGLVNNYGEQLTVDSLLYLCKELINVGSSRTLTISSTNLAKLADIYVKIVDITDEMRAEDDLIDSKLPFEVCESTDEGAMLIADYVLEKKWTLK